MRKRFIVMMLVLSLGLTGCLPFLGGNMIARDDLFDADGDIHSLEMQQGVTVKELYDAIKRTVTKHPEEFTIEADDYGSQKATVWTYSNKYKEHVFFQAIKLNNNVYLGIDIGEKGATQRGIEDIYRLEDLVTDNLKK